MPVEPSTRIYSWSGVNLVVMADPSTGFELAEITVWHEGRGDYLGRLGAATDRHLEFCAGDGMCRWHEAEGDGLAQRWREAAAGDDADGGAGCIEDLCAFAGRGAFDDQADANADEFALTLREDACGAREVCCLPAALGYGKAEAGFDGGDGLVEVVAIERQAGLEAQAVAGAKTDGFDAGIGQQ